jgi:hypothetical protein
MRYHHLFVFSGCAWVLIAAPALAQPIEVTLEPETDRAGGDYRNFESPLPARCQSECEKDARCRAYTFVNPGIENRKFRPGHCWLKSKGLSPSVNPCCVSGVKRPKVKIPPWLNPKELTLASARAMARLLARPPTSAPAPELSEIPVAVLARALFVLEVEAPSEAVDLQRTVKRRTVKRYGREVNSGAEVLAQVGFYHELFDVPCTKTPIRLGTAWPPAYRCDDAVTQPTSDPVPVIRVGSPLRPLVNPPTEADPSKDEKKTNDKLADKRKALLAERDKSRVDPWESLKGPAPTEFCVAGKGCKRTYKEVVAAIYGLDRLTPAARQEAEKSLPVFCAPKETGKGKEGKPLWDSAKVHCSSQWLDTLGGWKPWTVEGKAAPAPKPGTLPDYACFGSPHIVASHMILPAGGSAGTCGFHCRRRIFQILAKDVEKSLADHDKNIATQCAEMRQQVWGEKYHDINSSYQKWCHGPEGPENKDVCLPKDAPIPGAPGSPALPFMLLSREELLYFFGHQELFCRANRPGLTHFLYNNEWAETFTCAIPRGLLEAGPFEEGVQVCAVVPFAGAEGLGGELRHDDLKARLHCWKFQRPTCEELSKDPTTDDIHKSNVFDVFDTLREARRTQNKDAWALLDLKDAEKLASWQEKTAFSDIAKDEGTFGVKEFCRFVGNRSNIQCGYTKDTMARWYELRSQEWPEGCTGGICARGAYRRGYYCGLFQSKDLFWSEKEFPDGKPHWVCGLDRGDAGRKILENARAVCFGGARVKKFQSPKGDKGSLQCYERRFRWGESAESEAVLQALDWGAIVSKSGEEGPWERWLVGGDQLAQSLMGGQGLVWRGNKFVLDEKKVLAIESEARKHVQDLARADVAALSRWAKEHGHTLGHRTSMRIALMGSQVPVIRQFQNLSFSDKKGIINQRPSLFDIKDYVVPVGCRDKCYGIGASMWDGAKDGAKRLNELLDDVKKATRTADDKWFQEFRIEATDGGELRISPKDLELVVRVHHLFRVLDKARSELLGRIAPVYARRVLQKAYKSPPLARLEILEQARLAPLAERFKGNLFCVAYPTVRGQEEYACGSSPILIAGHVENAIPPSILRRGPKSAARAQVKFGWCYGAMEGKPLFGLEPLRVLSQQNLSSPYLMELPASVIGKPLGGDTRPIPGMWNPSLSAATWLKCTGFAYSDENWELADPSREKKAPPPPAATVATAPPAPGQSGEATAAVAGISDPKAREQAGAIMGKVGGLLGSVVNLVLPQFGDALERVRDLGHASSEFLEKWLGKFLGVAETQWKRLEGLVNKGKEAFQQAEKASSDALEKKRKELGEEASKGEKALKDAQEKMEKARDAFHKAEVFAAGQTGPAAEKANTTKEDLRTRFKEAESAVGDAKKSLAEMVTKGKKELDSAQKAAERAVTAAKKELEKVVQDARNEKVIQGTGDLLNGFLEDLIAEATKRVMAVVEPNARNLVARGFKFVRQSLDPVAQGAIGSLAALPFGAGAALAPLAHAIYSMALDSLENGAFDLLRGIVERMLGKLVRQTINPFFSAAKGKVLKLAYGVCAATHPEICPKGTKLGGELRFSALPARDLWIDRALACSGPPVFDESVYRKARLARAKILDAARKMRRDVAYFARDMADHLLAGYGQTYGSWVAAFGPNARPELVARVGQIEDQLRKKTAALQSRRARP